MRILEHDALGTPDYVSIFLIEEMSHPPEGLMKISSAPARNALSHLG